MGNTFWGTENIHAYNCQKQANKLKDIVQTCNLIATFFATNEEYPGTFFSIYG